MEKHELYSRVFRHLLISGVKEVRNLMVYKKDLDQDGREEIIALYNGKEKTVFKEVNKQLITYDESVIYPAYINAVNGRVWGYINSKGKYVIKPEYRDAYEFEGPVARVKKGDYFGVIDKNGAIVIQFEYDDITEFREERTIGRKQDKYYVLDVSGRVLSQGYDEIRDYHDGLAVFKDNNLYGYLDLSGKVAKSPIYQFATAFSNGKAVVKDQKYHLIDKSGSVLRTYQFYDIDAYSSDILVIKDRDLYGYMFEDGRVLLPPEFHYAYPIENSTGIVVKEGETSNLYGIINKEGKTVYNPEYNAIINLGGNRFAIGKAVYKDKPYLGVVFALGDDSGRLLTDFRFSDISRFHNNFASGTVKDKTCFLDLMGEFVSNLPCVNGSGTLKLTNGIVRAQIDYEGFYLDVNSEVINYPNYIIPVTKTTDVIINKYKPNQNYLVYYPQIENIEIQNRVNHKLREISLVKSVPSFLPYTYYGDFTIIFVQKNLMEISIEGYRYHLGAAHGFPYQEYVRLDLKTGVFYELSDLFIENCDYMTLLTEYVLEAKKKDSSIYIDASFKLTTNPLFYVDAANLILVFKPYEIAPYSEGLKKIIIPFTDIFNCINRDGEFYQAFN